MNNQSNKLLLLIFLLAISACAILYRVPSAYHLYSVVLGILVGLLFFILIPKSILNKFFFTEQVEKMDFIFLCLVGSFLITWPVILVLYTGIDIRDSNFLFLGIVFLTMCALQLIYEIYNKFKQR